MNVGKEDINASNNLITRFELTEYIQAALNASINKRKININLISLISNE